MRNRWSGKCEEEKEGNEERHSDDMRDCLRSCGSGRDIEGTASQIEICRN